MNKGLSIILPVKPPEPYLEQLKKDIEEKIFYLNIPHEIIVQTEKGLTNAVCLGVQNSHYDLILVMDADGSHNPLYMVTMWGLITYHGYDMVLGSKNVRGSKDISPFHRRLISLCIRDLARIMLGLEVGDPLAGFVMAKREYFDRLLPTQDYKFVLQLLCMKPNTYEIPIIFEERKAGKSKAQLSTGIRAIQQIFHLKLKQMQGKYN